jgi:hypothetical protein
LISFGGHGKQLVEPLAEMRVVDVLDLVAVAAAFVDANRRLPNPHSQQDDASQGGAFIAAEMERLVADHFCIDHLQVFTTLARTSGLAAV